MYMRTTIAIESATFVGPAKHSVRKFVDTKANQFRSVMSFMIMSFSTSSSVPRVSF